MRCARICGRANAIPMHYGTTPLLAGTPDQLIRAMGPNISTKVVVMQPGETRTF